jgi:hypothetical protein
MTWSTLKRKAGVRLASLGEDLKPLKFVYFIAVRVGDVTDYREHWTSRGMDEELTLRRILNTKNAHDATETTEKGIVREIVQRVEAEIVAENPKIKPETLLKRIASNKEVQECIKAHDTAAQMFVIGDTRGADGEPTKTDAAKVGKELLKQDPEKLKALAAELGIEL